MKPGPKRRDEMVRFMEQVSPEPNSGCWLWTGPVQVSGHAQFCTGGHQGKKVMAYRFSYERFVAPIPDGLFVCHRCDVPQCVNPDHMFLGSQKDNMRDAKLKGRAKGAPAKSVCGVCSGAWHVQSNGAKVCPSCQRIRARTHYWNNLEAERNRARAKTAIRHSKKNSEQVT